MPKYRRMTDPGYTSPFISRMPGIPASMEDDRDPEYEYKDELDEDDDGDKPEPNDDGTWDPVLWMAGMCGVILILYGLLS